MAAPSRLSALVVLVTALACGSPAPAPAPAPKTAPEARKQKESPDGATLTPHALDGRDYLLFHPHPGDPAPHPVVLALHGRGSSAKVVADRLDLAKLGPTFPFVIVIPDGTCSPGSDGQRCAWNSGNSIAGLEGGADDVRHLTRLLDAVGEQVAVDADRVFVFGFSNGGKMAYRLAAEKPARVAGIGVIGASIGGRAERGAPEHRSVPSGGPPVNVFHLHGLDDTVVPPFPDERLPSLKGHTELGVRESVGTWIRHNRTTPALPERLPRGDVWTSTGGRGGTRVHVELDPGRAHDWTNGDFRRLVRFFSECERR